MLTWLQNSFQENSILWLLLSSILGGIIGASMRFVFEVILPQQLQQRQQVIAAKRRYATPILLAAEDLRRRLENIIRHIQNVEREDWLSGQDPTGYFFLSTLYVVGQFFGWLQILRRTVVYLDFTTTRETRKYERFLDAIEIGFSDPGLFGIVQTSYPSQTQDQWVFTFHLQAIGTAMIIRDGDENRTLDFASFHKKFTENIHSEVNTWFSPLVRLFEGLTADDPRFHRLVAIHAILNAFIEYVDANHLRTESSRYHWDLLSAEEAESIRQKIYKITKM